MSNTNQLSKEEVLHLAKLAGLTLTEEEIKKNAVQLAETIDYVQNLNELNTTDVAPTNSVVDLSNVTFEDGARNSRGLTQEEATANGKNIQAHAFAVERLM